MTDYKADLAQKLSPAVMAGRVARVRQLYQQLGPWIDKYRGGFPKGFATAAMQWESDGVATTVGDPNLGEYGYYQVTAEFPTTIGLPSDSRYDPENNVFLGMMNYQVDVVRMAAGNPAIRLGTIDSWKLARLAFAIGLGGTNSLIARASAWRAPVWGHVFDNVMAYVDAGGANALTDAAGTQSADLVWYRVHTVDVVWQIGQQAFPLQSVGPPTLVPAPPAGPYTLPASVAPFFRQPTNPLYLALVAAAAGVALWRSR